MSSEIAAESPNVTTGPGVATSAGLLLCRVLAGGALVLAGILKLKGGPLIFQMSIEAFKLLPEWSTLPLAYFLPWLEIFAGLAMVLGVWTRQSALVVTGLYAVFTVGLLSVLARGMDVDCGCFGGLFGESTVGALTIVRNSVFIALSATCLVLGGGRFSVTPDNRPT